MENIISAYLDNNIIIEIEQENLILEDLLNKIDPSINRVYFSSAHLQEAYEIKGNVNERELRLQKRFNTISSITKNNYLFQELKSNNIYTKKESPENVYKTVTSHESAQLSMKTIINMLPEEQKKLIRKQLKINSVEINNYTPEEVINQVNNKDLFGGDSILELIEKGINTFPNNNDFGLDNRFAGIFEILDMIGYWKDKYTSKSNYARLWDSNHAYFSHVCDYFISDDLRTRNKAKVAFHNYEITTKVLSSKKE